MLKLKIKKLDPSATLPTYAHGPEEDAGMDLYALEATMLKDGMPTLVRTGISIELPPYYEAQVRARGGLALKYGIQVVNSPGTVDPGYRGEIGVILLWNGYEKGFKSNKLSPGYQIQKGDRIAQMVIAAYVPVELEEVTELGESTRGTGAYGSTG